MKIRWCAAALCVALAGLAPWSGGQAAAMGELQAALSRAWSAHTFRMSVAIVQDVQGDSGIEQAQSWMHRAELVARPGGGYDVNMVQTASGQPLTQTVYLPARSCLRPHVGDAWACADRAVDGQISNDQLGWVRSQPFLLSPDMAMRVVDRVTRRLAGRTVDVFSVDLGAGWPLIHVAVDRATSSLLAVGMISLASSDHTVFVLRFSDWNDGSITIPATLRRGLALPRTARHPLVAVPAGAAPFALLWPLFAYPTTGQYDRFERAMELSSQAMSVSLAVSYIDPDGSHGAFAGQLVLMRGYPDLLSSGSVNGAPRVDVAITGNQECVRHPGQRWRCVGMDQTTRYPILDVLLEAPFLDAGAKGTVLYAGAAAEHGRVLDHYLVINGIDRLITVTIDRASGRLAMVQFHSAGLGVLNIQIAYDHWNAPARPFPLLPRAR